MRVFLNTESDVSSMFGFNLYFLIISCFLYQNSCAKVVVAEHTSIMRPISQENGKTLFESDESINHLHAVISGDKKFYEVLNLTLQNHLNPLYDEKRRLVFDIFMAYEELYNVSHTTILDITSWQDLEILCGPKEHLSSYVAKKIDRTYTEMGKIYFYRKIVTPTATKAELFKNQAIIRELTENNDLFEAICKELKELQETEGCVLSFWKEDIFENLLKQNTFRIPFAKKMSTAANKSTVFVEIANTGYLVGIIGSNLMLATGGIVLPALGIARLINEKSSVSERLEAFNEKHLLDKKLELFSISALALSFFATKYTNKYTKSASEIIGAPMSGMNVLTVGDTMKGLVSLKNCIQTKLMYLARYMNALKNLSALAQKNPILSKYFPELKDLNKQLKLLEKKFKDIAQLLHILKTDTFKGEPSFFSWYGRMYVGYQLFSSNKDLFLPYMMTGAQLDTYISTSKLMREFKDRDITFCFPSYLDTELPTLEIQDFWNPAIDPKRAISNSLVIGHDDHPHNVMVTGPNAGGKSTTMKGLVLNIILAQSLGIAAAKSFSLTPFSTIMTYMNIPDDIMAGKSHFRAEASRAKNLLTAAQSSTDNHFTFIILDEVFNGTTFDEAQAATYALLEAIIENQYTTCIAVTHLPHIPSMAEKSGKFGLYKVTSSINCEGLIHYSHKLKSGISREPSIAFKILKQEGFDDKFLTRASEFLHTHRAYS